MSNRYSLVPVSEANAPDAVARLGALLADSPGWVGSFIVFLDGLDFSRSPSMTAGATFFEGATRADRRGREIIEALDDVYRDVRDGEQAASVHGHILEQFVQHALAGTFGGSLGPCELHCDGSVHAPFKFDAATGGETPCAGVEAKTSTRALKSRGEASRAKAKAKAAWVTTLLVTTHSEVAGVWATWVPEEKFRTALESLIGTDAERALIVGHDQLRQLPARLALS